MILILVNSKKFNSSWNFHSRAHALIDDGRKKKQLGQFCWVGRRSGFILVDPPMRPAEKVIG